MNRIAICMAVVLLPSSALAGAIPMIQPDGPVQIHHLSLELPADFQWLRIWPCGDIGPIRSVVARKDRYRDYRFASMTIDGPTRVDEGRTIDDLLDLAWQQRALINADELSRKDSVLPQGGHLRVGRAKAWGGPLNVAVLVLIIDGDAYTVTMSAPDADAQGFRALIRAAQHARRQLPDPSSPQIDPFCEVRATPAP